MNRGLAHRTIFETRRDIRYFLACLGRRARAGEIEVHAYSILTTHFHLLVRSPRGALSAVMQRVLDSYVRWFNLTRRRDGPLFRGRFVNRVVESEAYWFAVLAYVDRNPVEAGLVDRAIDYPHGSAWHYAKGKGPLWLSRGEVEAAYSRMEGEPWDPSFYPVRGRRDLSPGALWLLRRRSEEAPPRRGQDPLDELLAAAPGHAREWMERNLRLADGKSPGWPVASPDSIRDALGPSDADTLSPQVATKLGTVGRRELLEIGLLRLFSGLRLEEISARTGHPVARVHRRLAVFEEARATLPEFRQELIRVLGDALERDHDPSRPRWRAPMLLDRT